MQHGVEWLDTEIIFMSLEEGKQANLFLKRDLSTGAEVTPE